jgi:hypothetical protein
VLLAVPVEVEIKVEIKVEPLDHKKKFLLNTEG